VTDMTGHATTGRGAERPGDLLARVAAMTRPKSGMDLGGMPRKMPRAHAARAAACVSRIMARLGLNPAKVCIAAGLRGSANNCYDFHLTAGELAACGPVEREKPFNGTLDKYRLIVEAAALLSSGAADPADLRDELAEAVRDYLAPFAPRTALSAHREVGEALAALGAYLSKPRTAPDGTTVDLPGYFRACRSRGLSYDPGPRAMVPAGDGDPSRDWPCVTLGSRIAGFAPVSCSGRDGEPCGIVPSELVYGVGLAACPGGDNAVVMRFALRAHVALALGPRASARGGQPDDDPFRVPAVVAR